MSRERVHERITGTIGNTPLIQLRHLGRGLPGRVVLKHEGFNPYGSVKDRIGVAMVEDALQDGSLRDGMLIVEPTSGNTGIGVAFAAAAYGFRCLFTMPDTMTVERRHLLRALGATLVLTPGDRGMPGAIERATAIAERLGAGAWMPGQFRNPSNPAIHYRTTGPEIWEGTGGKVAVFVSGIGTGGTITGAGRYLRERNPDLRVVAVEPAESAVLSGREPGKHRQQGIGPGFVPEILDTTVYHEVVTVTNEDAIATTRRLVREEAIFTGISGGSITWAALQVAARDDVAGQTIVSIIPDFGERYLSNPVYTEAEAPDLPPDIRAALE